MPDVSRWLPEVPIYEIQVGNDEGQVPLMKLQNALGKLPRNLRGDGHGLRVVRELQPAIEPKP